MNYLEEYEKIFDGGTYVRHGKQIVLDNYRAFDGGGARVLIPHLKRELEGRLSANILDFGCGEALQWHRKLLDGKSKNMMEVLGSKVRGFYRYDPCVKAYAQKPPAGIFDIIICSDVMEHIPEENLEALIQEIDSYSAKGGITFYSISTKPSANCFNDGTNMHITIREPEWWITFFRRVSKGNNRIIFNGALPTMLSHQYRSILNDMHTEAETRWGSFSATRVDDILKYSRGETRILDYGSGHGGFRKAVESRYPGKYTISEYDPGVKGKDKEPAPAPYVICIDVLEHVEPEFIDAVLNDLQRVTERCAYVTIECAPALITLPDGRNAHLLQETPEWWYRKMSERFKISFEQHTENRVRFQLEKL